MCSSDLVLLRALQPALGIDAMVRRRGVDDVVRLARGPANLCAALGVDRRFDGVDLTDAEGPLFIAEDPGWSTSHAIAVGARIGVSKAVDRPLRFYLEGCPYVSRGKSVKAPRRRAPRREAP